MWSARYCDESMIATICSSVPAFSAASRLAAMYGSWAFLYSTPNCDFT